MANDLKHHHLTWHIENIYLWGEVLKTVVNGPNFRWEGPGSPWMLKLGQSTKPQSSDIVLFIKRLGTFASITANVRVTAHKDNNLNPLLSKNFRVTFNKDAMWESPVLCTNQAFKRESSSKNMSKSWEIKVQLMWQEILNYPPSKDKYFLRQEKVGTDLKAFINNDKYSDISIRCDDGDEEYVPAHKAILAVRCPYLCRKIDSYPGEDWTDVNEDLFPSQDSTTINTLLKYFYTGNVKYVTENNPLPIEVLHCAKEMEIRHLEKFTQPYYFAAKTIIKTETVTYEWAIRPFDIMRGTQEPMSIESEPFGKPNKEQFIIHVTLSPPKQDSSGSIEAFLRFETKGGRKICVNANFMVKNYEGKIILRRRAANHDMAPKDFLLCVSIVEIDEDHMKTNSDQENLFFSCEIQYSKNETEAFITEVPLVKSVYQSDFDINPIKRHCAKVYQSWIADFVEDLEILFLNEMHSDCSIIVGKDKFPAHRVILEARSPYFLNYIHYDSHGRLEVFDPMEFHVEKDIKISTQVMKIILEEIYTGSASIPEELSQEIHAAAIAFGLRELEVAAKHVYEFYSIEQKFKDIP